MKPGKTPPSGGQWLGDWTSLTGLCHTADFRGREYRDAVQLIGSPTTSYRFADAAPGAFCFAKCPESEDLEKHDQAWTDTRTTGWSITGSFSLTVDISKAAKATAGVSKTYNEAKSTSVKISVPYKHSTGPDNTYREWSCSILEKKVTYNLKVYRYFLAANGQYTEVRDLDTGNQILRVEDRGTITITQTTFAAGRPGAVDRPCSSYPEALPGTEGVETEEQGAMWDPQSGSDSVRNWAEYRSADAGMMALALLKSAEFTPSALELLTLAAEQDGNKFGNLVKDIREDAEGDEFEPVVGTSPWVISIAKDVESLPMRHKKAILEALKTWQQNI